MRINCSLFVFLFFFCDCLLFIVLLYFSLNMADDYIFDDAYNCNGIMGSSYKGFSVCSVFELFIFLL